MNKPLIVIGGGHAGAQMGASLRQEGYDGRIVLISSEDTLPYHKPPLSKAFQKDPATQPQVLRAEGFYSDNAIELALGQTVERIDTHDRTVSFSDGRKLGYSTAVLATGAKARSIEALDGGFTNCLSLRTLADANALRDAAADANDIVVIGGGFIGMELAFTFAGLSKNVTVLEAAPRLVGRAVAPVVSDHMHARAQTVGIRIVSEATIEAVDSNGRRITAVRVKDQAPLPADLVIVGVGVDADNRLAREAGLACENGIAVDDHLRTANANILAIGDCAHFRHGLIDRKVRLESVQNATDQAKHAARTITGTLRAYDDVPWFWSDMGDTKIQMAGVSFDADEHILTGSREDNAFSVFHLSAGKLVAVDSINQPAVHMISRRLIAAGHTPQPHEIAGGAEGLKQAYKAISDAGR